MEPGLFYQYFVKKQEGGGIMSINSFNQKISITEEIFHFSIAGNVKKKILELKRKKNWSYGF